jgi:peptide/nickel transport system substrate-binding protein
VRRALPVSFACLLLACSAACRGARDAEPSSAAVTLRVGVADPRRGTAPQAGVAQLSRLLRFAPVVTLGRDGRPRPALAERWEAADDARAWRFHLRPGLTFHDGSPLTSAEVRASWAPATDPSLPGMPPGLRDIAAIETSGPEQVVVRLHRPSALLLESLALLPITTDEARVGAGPFKPVADTRTVADEATTLEAFPGHYHGRPRIDRLEIRSFPAPRSAWSALMRGEIDFLYEVAPEAVEFLRASADVQALSFLRPYVYVVGFNMAHPVLKDVSVRRALNQAVDRAFVIARALGGRGVPAYDHVWPGHWTFDAGLGATPYDPRAAAAALDRAGWTVRRTSAGERFPQRFRLTCLLPASYPQFERVGLIVQKQFADVGVDLALEVVPLAELQRRLAEGRYDAYLFEMAGGPGLSWPYRFWHSPETGEAAFVRSGYSAANAPLDRVRNAMTDDELRDAVRTLRRVFVEDPPALFLCWGETARAVRRTFRVPAGDERDVLSTLPEWEPVAGVGRR